MHGIAYDPIHDEFTVPQQFGQAIMTFRGGSNGEVPPARIIQGSLTQLQDPDHLDVDAAHNEIFVPQRDKILVYPRDADGNVAPIRVLDLAGSDRDTSYSAEMLGVDPIHNLLVVGASLRRQGSRLLIFNRTDEGNAKPKAIIGGPNSKLGAFGGPFAIYPEKGWIIASIRGTGPFAELSSDEAFVGVWSENDTGDVPPKWTIGGPKGVFRMPRGIAIDAKHKSIMVSDKRLNSVLTFYFPELF